MEPTTDNSDILEGLSPTSAQALKTRAANQNGLVGRNVAPVFTFTLPSRHWRTVCHIGSRIEGKMRVEWMLTVFPACAASPPLSDACLARVKAALTDL